MFGWIGIRCVRTDEILFGHSKPTVPYMAAVPAALSRERSGREYLNVSREAAHGAACCVVVGRCVEGGVGFDIAADGRRVAAWGELAAPIARDHNREHGVVDVGISVAVVDHRRKTNAFAFLTFFFGRLVAIQEWRRVKEAAIPARRFGLTWNTAITQFISGPRLLSRAGGCSRARMMY